MPLSDSKIKATKPGDAPVVLHDGFGLYLEISPAGKRSWKFRYRVDGKRSKVTIGQYPLVSLQEARAERDRLRKMVDEGQNPSAEKKAKKIVRALEKSNTFESVSREFISKNEAKWTPLYTAQLISCFEKNVFPSIGKMPVREVTPAHVLHLLQAMEARGVHTYAIQVRQWISAVYRYAVVTLRAEFDPAAPLKGAITRPPINHARALSIEEIADFTSKVSIYAGYRVTVIALKVLLYTFVRTVEMRKAEWSEINLSAAEWQIPAERMKMRRIHVIPLSRQVVALLEELKTISGAGRFLFPGMRRPQDCMSATTINRALEHMGYASGQFTAHDFRATASTRLHELGYRTELIERQLAHVEGNKTKRSYNHAEYLEERRKLMQDWADFVDQAASRLDAT